MSLKTATRVALIGVWLNLVVGLFDRFLWQFNPSSLWIGTTLQFVLVLLNSIPMLVFLTILARKQPGD